uniref:Transcription initiation factor IIA gamma subunit C-terminal domain-containing protein n=1 Tax=Monodon monoceros TaxID=40151 RepID=A0A8C6CHZ3_MONMO
GSISVIQKCTLGNSLQEGADKFLPGSAHMYTFCDNVWTSVLSEAEFREMTELIKVDKVKIVTYDGKNTGFNTTGCIEEKWLFSAVFCH